jgi:ATP-dependent Lon protease
LHRVLFIGTANVAEAIPPALRDRFEIIHLPGYTEEEKLAIGRRYLVRRQRSEAGLSERQLRIEGEALLEIIRRYTREAGVRNLERNIGAICRSVATRVASGERRSMTVGRRQVAEILGTPKYESEVAMRTQIPGVATGLAWTPFGGEILFIEATAMPGKGRLRMTGQLGAVMKESAQTALSLVRTKAERLGLDPGLFEETDLHVHIPAGSIPKDGPSAGVAMYTALVSLLTKRRVRSDLAMTGEISLRGLVLPVGGIKEKVLGALAAGIRCVILPKRNRADLDEIPESARKRLEFVLVDRVEQVIESAFEEEEIAPVRRASVRRKPQRAPTPRRPVRPQPPSPTLEP